MSRKRKILDILGMILGVLLVIVNGMMVGLEYMYQVGDKIYMLGTMRDKMIPLVFGVFCFPKRNASCSSRDTPTALYTFCF